MKNFVEELRWRGMIQDMMPGTEEQLQKEMTSEEATSCEHKSVVIRSDKPLKLKLIREISHNMNTIENCK